MSSSRSGQWMPSPRPMRRHFERSAEVPWAKRGYQERGTLTVLPSTKSTTKASSVTETCCASATRSSLAEELIPCSAKLAFVLPDHGLQSPDLDSAKPAALSQPYRIEPELATVPLPLDMHVAGLVPVSGIEEKPIRPDPENRRHPRILRQGPAGSCPCRPSFGARPPR